MKNTALICGIILCLASTSLLARKSSHGENKIIKSLNQLQKIHSGILLPVCSEEYNKSIDDVGPPYYKVNCSKPDFQTDSCKKQNKENKLTYIFNNKFSSTCEVCGLSVEIKGTFNFDVTDSLTGSTQLNTVASHSYDTIIKACKKLHSKAPIDEDATYSLSANSTYTDILDAGLKDEIDGDSNIAEISKDKASCVEVFEASNEAKEVGSIMNTGSVPVELIRDVSYFEESEDFTWTEQGLKQTLVYSQDRMADVVKKYPEFKTKSSDQAEDTLYTHFIFEKEAPSKEFLENKLSAMIRGEKTLRANEGKIINIDQCFIESTKKPWILRVSLQNNATKIKDYSLDCNVFGEVSLKEK